MRYWGSKLYLILLFLYLHEVKSNFFDADFKKVSKRFSRPFASILRLEKNVQKDNTHYRKFPQKNFIKKVSPGTCFWGPGKSFLAIFWNIVYRVSLIFLAVVWFGKINLQNGTAFLIYLKKTPTWIDKKMYFLPTGSLKT